MGGIDNFILGQRDHQVRHLFITRIEITGIREKSLVDTVIVSLAFSPSRFIWWERRAVDI